MWAIYATKTFYQWSLWKKKKASKVNDGNIYLTQYVPNRITLTYV